MDNNTILNFNFKTERPSIIKVIGVGGGGGNAVTHMYKEGIHDVSFLLCNTDYQALIGSDVPTKLQLGKEITEGLGAGNNPEKAEQAAEESKEDIKSILSDGTKMVFITAGMGGGTGTGAAPVIAKITKEMGILTVGIVTIPFFFEGENKILQALNGVEKISKNVDALLVINNEKLREVYPDLTVLNAFGKADDTLTVAAKSIAEIITVRGHINLDFADVHTILKDGGVSIMSSGYGEGENRVMDAIKDALNSPLLNNNDVTNAKKILLNVSFSEKQPLKMEEMNHINDFMARFETKGKGIENFIWGAAVENDLENKVKITLLATGFGVENIPEMKKKKEHENAEDELKRKRDADLITIYYGKEGRKKIGKTTRPKPFIFSVHQLDDDRIIDLVVNHPAYNRNPNIFESVENSAEDKEDKNEEQNTVIKF